MLEVVLVLPGFLIHVRSLRPSLPLDPRGVTLFVSTVVLRTREISIVDICWSEFSSIFEIHGSTNTSPAPFLLAMKLGQE